MKMRQKYFSVPKQVFEILYKDIEEYNLALKGIYNKDFPKDEKVGLMSKKEEIEEKIKFILEEDGELLGFFNEQDMDKLYKIINSLESSSVKKLLSSNIIKLDNIDEILVQLGNYTHIDVLKKLIVLLENAKQVNKSIIVWIM